MNTLINQFSNLGVNQDNAQFIDSNIDITNSLFSDSNKNITNSLSSDSNKNIRDSPFSDSNINIPNSQSTQLQQYVKNGKNRRHALMQFRRSIINENPIIQDSDCPICMNHVSDDTAVALPCHPRHILHKECLLLLDSSTNAPTRCPVCRVIVSGVFIDVFRPVPVIRANRPVFINSFLPHLRRFRIEHGRNSRITNAQIRRGPPDGSVMINGYSVPVWIGIRGGIFYVKNTSVIYCNRNQLLSYHISAEL